MVTSLINPTLTCLLEVVLGIASLPFFCYEFGVKKLLYHTNLLPGEIYFAPLVPIMGWLAVKHGGFTFLDSNPSLRYSGLIDDSKSEIYSRFKDSRFTLPSQFLSAKEPNKKEIVETFWKKVGKSHPIVLKPDRGFRGQAVHICTDEEQVTKYLNWAKFDIQLQMFSPLPVECMVYWYREKGRLHFFSAHTKAASQVTGDGQSTVFELVEKDPFLGLIAKKLRTRDPYIPWQSVPEKGQKVPVSRIMKRGLAAKVTNVRDRLSEKFRDWAEELLAPLEGFNVGRFDMKLGDLSDFETPQNIKIIELNGASAESGLLNQFSLPLFDEYHTMYKTWELAFKVGAESRKSHPEKRNSLLPFLRDLYRVRDVKRTWQEADWF